jgi:hypothetical protein
MNVMRELTIAIQTQSVTTLLDLSIALASRVIQELA